ncbi:SymE family type I addiction module toxin [Larkinella sp. GY13]|uniref:SymE family type I addiction module toxin n=1 Tax=Larkinella sp. GY13 TaxID=3453720 RepID=UPI003EE89C30
MGYQPRQNVYRQIRFVPALLLAGVWLQKAGFERGQSVTVTVEKGQILISN